MSIRPRREQLSRIPFSSIPAVRREHHRGGVARLAAAAMLAGVAVLAGCSNANDDKARAVSKAALEAPGFTRAWRADVRLTGDDTVKDLFVTEDTVHVLTANNYAHALKRGTGELQFFNAVAPSSAILREPVVLKQFIVYPTVNSLEVYNRRGRFVKSMPFNVSFTSNGAGTGSVMYIGTDETGGRLASVDVEKAALPMRWTLLTNGTVSGRAAIYQGKIFCGSNDGSVRAMEDDRSALWPMDGSKFQTSGPIVADVKADEAGVYAASTDGRLYCIDRASGRLRWQFFGGPALKAAPVVTAASVYQYVPSHGVAAVDKSKQVSLGTADNKMVEQLNRSPRWVVSDAKQFLAEDDRLTYLLGDDGSVIAVDQKTGQEQFRSKRDDFTLWGTNTGKDGTIYAATKDGAVFAVKAVPQQ